MNPSNKLLATLFGILFSPLAFAVQYSVPSDGWYQLQSLPSYETVCSSIEVTCDVPAGQYVLVNHSLPVSEAKHRQKITISEPNAQFSIKTTVVYQDCINGYPGRPLSSDDEPCVASCPDGYARTGGSCKASRKDTAYVFNNGVTTGTRDAHFRVPTLDTPIEGGFSCELDKSTNFTPIDAPTVRNNFTTTDIQAMAICAIIVTQ